MWRRLEHHLPPNAPRSRSASKSGTTLVEAVIATLILAFAVSAVATALMAGTQQSYEALDASLAADLAQGVMEEIIALPYNDPDGSGAIGPDAGETDRTLFDNMDDYHGFSEVAGAVSDAQGTAYPSLYDRFDRTVSVQPTTVESPSLGLSVPGILITVTVRQNNRVMVVLTQTAPEPT